MADEKQSLVATSSQPEAGLEHRDVWFGDRERTQGSRDTSIDRPKLSLRFRERSVAPDV